MTVRYTAVFCALLFAASVPGAAQTASPEPNAAEQPAPERIAAATRLMDLMMPPAQREAMMAGMVEAMLGNITSGIMNNGPLKQVFETRPEARPVFERFVARQRNLAQQSMRQNLPTMIEAMAIAYARRFTPAQIEDMAIFFATPTGQAYATESIAIMSDPAVASWQQRVLAQDLERMPAEMTRLAAEMREIANKDGDNGE